MNSLKEQHERAIGDRIIALLNNNWGTSYSYDGRAGEAPDLTYRDRDQIVHVEMTSAYYNHPSAKLTWDLAQNKRYRGYWSGVDPDNQLIQAINTQLSKKATMRYGDNCILVIYVRPQVTTFEEIEARLCDIEVPKNQGFMAIYLAGDFGISSSGAVGGFHCWELMGNERLI